MEEMTEHLLVTATVTNDNVKITSEGSLTGNELARIIHSFLKFLVTNHEKCMYDGEDKNKILYLSKELMKLIMPENSNTKAH